MKSLAQSEIEYKERTWRHIESILSAHIQLEETDWQRLQARTLLEIDQHIAFARSLGKSPEQLDQATVDQQNAKLSQEREILLHGYKLSWLDYLEILVPILERLAIFPPFDSITFSGHAILERIFEVSQSSLQSTSEAYDDLVGFCDAFVVCEIARKVRKDYETLRKGLLLEQTFVRAVNTRKCCEKCKRLDGEYLNLDDLMKKFESHSIDFPHQLESEDQDEFVWCNGPTLINIPNDLWDLKRRAI